MLGWGWEVVVSGGVGEMPGKPQFQNHPPQLFSKRREGEVFSSSVTGVGCMKCTYDTL